MPMVRPQQSNARRLWMRAIQSGRAGVHSPTPHANQPGDLGDPTLLGRTLLKFSGPDGRLDLDALAVPASNARLGEILINASADEKVRTGRPAPFGDDYPETRKERAEWWRNKLWGNRRPQTRERLDALKAAEDERLVNTQRNQLPETHAALSGNSELNPAEVQSVIGFGQYDTARPLIVPSPTEDNFNLLKHRSPMPELKRYTPTLRERATNYLSRTFGNDDRASYRRAGQAVDVIDAFTGGLVFGSYDAGRSLAEGAKKRSLPDIGLGAAEAILMLAPGAQLGPVRRMLAKNVKKAEILEQEGASPNRIWRKAKVERGPTGEWIAEMSDKGFAVRPKAGKLTSDGARTGKVSDHYDHSYLFSLYPEIAHAKSTLWLDPRRPPAGQSNLSGWSLTTKARDMPEAKETGIHELQHFVNELDGLPRGGGQVDPDYWNLVGEVMARNAERRLYMPQWIRSLRPPSSTESVPRNHQIVEYW